MPSVGVKRDTALCESARFGIPAHIHVCVTVAGSVILDVRHDKYLGLGQKETELLADAVPGWPKPLWQRSVGGDESTVLQAQRATCESLLLDGVLERIPEGQEARPRVALKDMRGEWISIGDEQEVRGRMTPRHLKNFLLAYGWARYSLARRPFSVIVEEVNAAKRKRVRYMGRYDLRRLAAIVDIFRRLRPFAFAAEGHCLLHALTLTRFLSQYQLYPDWVIGVTMQPWGAHSWVQWDNYLLDSNPEKVCGYTPIMMV